MDQSPPHPTIEASARRRAAELGCTFERIVSFDELPEGKRPQSYNFELQGTQVALLNKHSKASLESSYCIAYKRSTGALVFEGRINDEG